MDECRSSTLDDVMRAVTMENIPFDFGAFLEMSPEGLHLLKGLLQRDPAKRITAKEAINHPWFKLHAAYEETSKENDLQVQAIFHISNVQLNACLLQTRPRQPSAPLLLATCVMRGCLANRNAACLWLDSWPFGWCVSSDNGMTAVTCSPVDQFL